MQPATFDEDLSEHWSRWVLENGLPETPTRLDVGESAPVAYWIGPTTAAVLHVRRVLDADENAPYLDVNVELFGLVDLVWENWGGGGANWPGSLPNWEDDGSLTRLQAPPQHVNLAAMNGGGSDEGGCKALWGDVATAAAIAEVSQGGQVTRRPIEAPLGILLSAVTRHKPSPCASWTRRANYSLRIYPCQTRHRFRTCRCT